MQVLICVAVTALLASPSSAVADNASETRRLPPVEDADQGPSLAQDAETLPPSLLDEPSAAVEEGGLSEEEIAALEAEVLADVAETPPWYGWIVPTYWHMPTDWDSSFELGIDGSDGNASTLTFRTGANLSRKVDWSHMKLAINYVKATAESVETKHNAQLEANHDWLLGESPWSLFAKTIVVYDEYRPFDLELTLNTGVGYCFVENDLLTFKGRFGSGAMRQWGSADEDWRPEAMFGVDFEYKISGRQKLRATSELFPEWGDFEVYRIRTDAGWEMLLDEATNMSLKLGVIDRYDSESAGTKPNAIDYSLLLLWKL